MRLRLEWMCAAPYIKDMKQAMRQLDRREFVLGSAAVVTLTALTIGDTMAQDATEGWEETVKKIVGAAKPTDGKNHHGPAGDCRERQYRAVHDQCR